MELARKDAEGLFWTPRGGNNETEIWASCHLFVSAIRDSETGRMHKDVLLVDMGRHETPDRFANGSFDVVIPALNDCLDLPRSKTPEAENRPAALFITHAHSDHINGIFEYVRMGVRLPPVYASEFTISMIKKGFVEEGVDWDLMPEFRTVHPGEPVRIGHMTVEAFPAAHSIPGSYSYKIANPCASVFHSGDIKADPTSFLTAGTDIRVLEKIGQDGGVDLMTFDATATHMEGHARHEAEICDIYASLFERHRDRQIIAPISPGHMERLATVAAAAQRTGKHIIINGGSTMQSHIMGLAAAGIHLDKMFPRIKVLSGRNPEARKIDPKNAVTVTTGIYGSDASPLVRALRKQEKSFPLRNDAVIIAPLTGERHEKLRAVMEETGRSGKLLLITATEYPGLYGSGHAQQDDFCRIAAAVRPKAVVPVHCSEEMARQLISLSRSLGYAVPSRPVRNGETVRVMHGKPLETVSSRSQEWYGIRHLKDEAGETRIRFTRLPDSRLLREEEKAKALEQKRREAERKIAEYRNRRPPDPAAEAVCLKRSLHDR